MQRESILLATKASNLEELHQCEKCGHQGLIDKNFPTSICECGFEICSSCFKAYNAKHRGKTCTEVAKTESKAKRKV